MDAQKDTIAIATAKTDSRDEPHLLDTMAFNVQQVEKALASFGCAPQELSATYEAGPCGYSLYRELTAKGYRCTVVAPSKVAPRPADRIKTYRRGPLLVARLHRLADLVAVILPDPAHEAVRDLMRARDDAVRARMCCRQQLSAFLPRLGKPYRGGKAWTQKHRRFLADVTLEDPNQQIRLTEYRLAVQAAIERIAPIEAASHEAFENWRCRPIIEALIGLRSIDFISAMAIVADIGDLRRFAHPR